MWKNKSPKIWVLLGLHVRSWVLTSAHLFLLGCLVVGLFVWLFLKPHQFFDLEKMGLKWRSLSDCSALDGIGNKPQAREPQEKHILWNLFGRRAAICFKNKNQRLAGVLLVKSSGGQKHNRANALQGFVEEIQDTKFVVLLNAPPLKCKFTPNLHWQV